MSDALIQIVNENDQPIGVATIKEAQEQGLYHRISRVMVEDEQGQLLLQLRNYNKGLYPGRWDNSAAGHVDEGEDYETAAKRETAEEIGLHNISLEELGYYRQQGSFEWRKLNRFTKVYKVVVPTNTKFEIDPDEVKEVVWFSLDEVKRMITEHPEQVTDGIIDVIQRYYP